MAEIVSATSGVMNPLLGKLTALLGEECKKLTGVRKQASFLRDELSAMKALLDKLELMDEPDPLAKDWRDHVREMSYDMENCIDDFIHDLGVAVLMPRWASLGRRRSVSGGWGGVIRLPTGSRSSRFLRRRQKLGVFPWLVSHLYY